MAAPAPAATTVLRPDANALRAFWEAVVRPGNVHEVRIPHSRAGPLRLFGTVSGYFDDADAFVAALRRVSGADASAVYITLNPVKPALLARARNRMETRARSTAGDGDVVRRRLLLIDIDPVRDPKDVSATQAELAAALSRRDSVQAGLADAFGWPAPVASAMSGNGGALLYAVDLPNDDATATLVQRVLAALDTHWSDALVKVDVVNYNAARITKVIGTVAAKGENLVGHPSLEDRPWRLATAIYPQDAQVVSVACLDALAAEAPQPTPTGVRPQSSVQPEHGPATKRTWTMADLLTANGLHASARSWQGGGTKYPLDHCLTSPDHCDGACLIEMPSGAVVYRCHHDRCAGKGWLYLREHGLIVVPGAQSSNGRNGHADTAHTAHTAQQQGSSGNGDTAHTAHTAQQAGRLPRLHDAAFRGVAGDIVRRISPQTEASEAALLVTLLVYFGGIIGSAPHARVTSKRHGTNLFAVLVGRTSGGRKGTSRAEIEALFRRIDAGWLDARVKTGLSTGEGLISAVRDATKKIDKDGSTLVLEEGIDDKRLVAIEEEFCSPVKLMAKEGNTLSALVRQAWDGHNLGTLTRNNPMTATRPHVCILGHTTQAELLKYLTETEMADGFANRFLWVGVERSKLLPHGGGTVDYGQTVERLSAAVRFARSCAAHPMVRDEDANRLWESVYPDLTAERSGMFGHVTSRAEAQALRLSVIYALLDQSAVVRVEHLAAALAVWEYCEESARVIFGQATGDDVADRILAALRTAGDAGVDLEEIREVFSRHLKPARRDAALSRLEEAGLAYGTSEETDGRPRMVYRLSKKEAAR